MAAFTPASDVWTLGYDQFDNICWQHKKTQELQYIPPGQPLTLPPRSLDNMFHQNFPNTLPDAPTATAHAEGLGEEAIHFNNSVLRVSETARSWPAIFVGYTQSHPLRMPRTPDGKQWFPPTGLENGPHWGFPNDPYFTSPATVRADASPHQGLGKGVHFNNSVPEVPEAARLQPASIMKGTKPQTLIPMSPTDEEKHGLPPRSLANAPLPNLLPEPDLTSTTKEHAMSPLLPGDDRGKHFDNGSTQEDPETARLRPAFIIEDSHHQPTQKSTTRDEKYGLPPMSPANAPLPNLPSEPHLIPSTNDHDRESLLSGGIEEDHININSTEELPDVARGQTTSIVDDTKSHQSPQVSKAEKPMLGSTPRSLANAPEKPPFIPAATARVETSLPRRDGEQGHLNNNSALEVPEAVRVRTASFIVEDTKPDISSVSGAENAERGLSPEISENMPRSDAIEDPISIPASTTRVGTSLLWEDSEGDLSDSKSSLNVPEAVRVWPASIVDTMPHPCHPISRTEEAKQWSRKGDIRGQEYYVNIITGESQYEKPDCLKKYTSRR